MNDRKPHPSNDLLAAAASLPPDERMAVASALLGHAPPTQIKPVVALVTSLLKSHEGTSPAEVAAEAAAWLLSRWSSVGQVDRQALSGAEMNQLTAGFDLALAQNADPAGLAAWLSERVDPRRLGMAVSLLERTGVQIAEIVEPMIDAQLAAQGIRITGATETPELAPGEVPKWLNRALRVDDANRDRHLARCALRWLAATGPDAPDNAQLAAAIVEPEHPAHRLLRATLRRDPAAWLHAVAWRWLASEPMRTAAADRLASPPARPSLGPMCRLGHLALRPARQDAARLIQVRTKSAGGVLALAGDGPLPTETECRELGTPERIGLARMLAIIPPTGPADRAAWEPLLASRDHAVRWIAATRGRPADLPDLTLDRHEAVATAAAVRWSATGTLPGPARVERPSERARAAHAALLARSPVSSVRRIAQEEQARTDPWSDLPAGRLAARAWTTRSRETFEAAAHRRLRTGTAAERISTLRAIDHLGMVSTFGDEIVALAQLTESTISGGARVAATAVTLLPRLVAGRALVGESLAHPDDRVRANGVESLAACTPAPRLRERVLELKSDPNHRVRANAVRALIGAAADESGAGRIHEPVALEGLAELLTDDRPMHRVAGVWGAARVLGSIGPERLGPAWVEISRRVADLAGTDTDHAVRRRASSAAARLLATLRAERDASRHNAEIALTERTTKETAA